MFQLFIKIPLRSVNGCNFQHSVKNDMLKRQGATVCETGLSQVYTYSLKLHTETVLKIKKKKKKNQYDSVFSGIL